jgi:hypothetical protein
VRIERGAPDNRDALERLNVPYLDLQRAVYELLRVRTPLSDANDLYACGDFHDIFARRVATRLRCCACLRVRPRIYLSGQYIVSCSEKRIRLLEESIDSTDKMPRNLTGGSGHRSQRNSEGGKERNNRIFVDNLLDDYQNGASTTGVYVGRITKRMGCGRMEVFYKDANDRPVTQIIAMRGGLRGKGKKSVWVDLDNLVMIAETGLAGTTHEIVAVFSEAQVARFKRVKPDADVRLFLKAGGSAEGGDSEAGYEFETIEEKEESESDGELDVDAI